MTFFKSINDNNYGKVKKLKENGKTVYPATIWNAVVDPTTGKTLKTLIGELNEALKKIDAISVKGYTPFTGSSGDPRGHIPVVKSTGSCRSGDISISTNWAARPIMKCA